MSDIYEGDYKTPPEELNIDDFKLVPESEGFPPGFDDITIGSLLDTLGNEPAKVVVRFAARTESASINTKRLVKLRPYFARDNVFLGLTLANLQVHNYRFASICAGLFREYTEYIEDAHLRLISIFIQCVANHHVKQFTTMQADIQEGLNIASHIPLYEYPFDQRMVDFLLYLRG